MSILIPYSDLCAERLEGYHITYGTMHKAIYVNRCFVARQPYRCMIIKDACRRLICYRYTYIQILNKSFLKMCDVRNEQFNCLRTVYYFKETEDNNSIL
jgi:hypothetical protein